MRVGRNDLQQLPLPVDLSDASRVNPSPAGDSPQSAQLIAPATSPPQELARLPWGAEVTEVWCGSEFTIAADDAGGLWASGWNEHGNLGTGVWETLLQPDQDDPLPTGKEEQLLENTGSTGVGSIRPASTVRPCTDAWRPILKSSLLDHLRATNAPAPSVPSGLEVDPLVAAHQVRIRPLWSGALSCGGGHVLCLSPPSAL